MIRLTLIEHEDKERFIAEVERFGTEHEVLWEACKFQRNLFYSLTGSTLAREKQFIQEGHELQETYLAFLLWRERALEKAP